MFIKKLRSYKNSKSHDKPFNPEQLDDLVAMQTQWVPISNEGANFQTHKLVNTTSYRIELRTTIYIKLFFITSITIGTMVLIDLSAHKFEMSHFQFTMNDFWPLPLLVYILFMGFIVYTFYPSTIPCCFDKKKDFFGKASKTTIN